MNIDERRQLARIELQIRRRDPSLAAAFDRWGQPTPPRRAAWSAYALIVLALVGTGLLAAAAVTASAVLGLTAVTLEMAAGAWWLERQTRRRPHPHPVRTPSKEHR